MAAMVRAIKKAFIRYTRENFPGRADQIIARADELFPVLSAEAPDIGGKENLMSYNLDLMILAASFYMDYLIFAAQHCSGNFSVNLFGVSAAEDLQTGGSE